MLNRTIIFIIIMLIYLCYLSPAVSYGQVQTPTKTSNKPQKQTAANQEQAKIISDAAQSPMTLSPLSVAPNRQEITPKNTHENNHKTTTDRWLLLFNGLIVVVVSFQVFWMIRQTKWMRKSGEAATESANVATETLSTIKDTTIRQLRAYIFVDKIFIGNIAHPVLPLGVKDEKTPAAITRPLEGPLTYLEFKNSGQTPAYDVISWGDICIREFPLTSTLPTIEFKSQLIARASIPPGGGTNKHHGIEKPFTDEEINKLRAFPPTAAIYVYGSISYRDTFGINRTTNYRYFHNSLSGILGQHTGMSICDEGNEAD